MCNFIKIFKMKEGSNVLLTKTTIIKWRKDNKEWYESKGYIFTNYGDKFEVECKNLNNESYILIEVKCDCPDCEKSYLKPMTCKNYKRYVHKDENIIVVNVVQNYLVKKKE